MKKFIMFIIVTMTAIMTMTGCVKNVTSLTVKDSDIEGSKGNHYEIVETEDIIYETIETEDGETETIIIETYD